MRKKKPLYRKVNTKASGVRHNHGSDYRDSRQREHSPPMRKGIQRGLDYTPLFKFLLSKVGSPWNGIFSEAISRLDKEAPIWWLVAKRREEAEEVIRLGESSYYSGLFIDEQGLLQKVAPQLSEDSLEPSCACCTHTFNGIPFTQRYQPDGI